MKKNLTIWIPTYKRPNQIKLLLDNLKKSEISEFAKIVISDNDPQSEISSNMSMLNEFQSLGIEYRANIDNLSAGANILRSFEYCNTNWLMILGDDDLLDLKLINEFKQIITNLNEEIIAIKFDSSLYGSQENMVVSNLKFYVDSLPSQEYPQAFNNLCLISNWLFRCTPCRKYISSAYLAYSTKISHLFPLLNACRRGKGKILFSNLCPIKHGISNDSWPKAPTWFEMIMSLTTFCGFVESEDRQSLLKLILHTDWKRNVAKCLRIHQFYNYKNLGISPWRIHLHLIFISNQYFLALLVSLPLLLLPDSFQPLFLQKKLGNPGTFERW